MAEDVDAAAPLHGRHVVKDGSACEHHSIKMTTSPQLHEARRCPTRLDCLLARACHGWGRLGHPTWKGPSLNEQCGMDYGANPTAVAIAAQVIEKRSSVRYLSVDVRVTPVRRSGVGEVESQVWRCEV